MSDKEIYVTKTYMPPLEEYSKYLETIWQNNQITNQGPLLKTFEARAASYLGVKNFHFVANGTLALQLAIRSIVEKNAEIITTPFSYVATTSAILWENHVPVFADIDSKSLNIDPSSIEKIITKKTKAILAVHVFGNPCDIEALEKIAKKHNLKIIYDGAHAFGVEYKNKSLLSYGDISISSFHATKPFHTIEGGCVITSDDKLSKKIDLMKRFGHNKDDHHMLGVNAKASEFNAAMGLCNLKHINEIIESRAKAINLYKNLFKDRFDTQKINSETTYNNSYYPIIFKSEKQALKILNELKKNNIYPRRYFYPSLNKLPYLEVSNPCPNSESIAKRILCLPLYFDMTEIDIKRITKIILRAAID